MTFREQSIVVIDQLLWAGSGAAILFFLTLIVLALVRGYVAINGQKATKLDEPIGYLIALAAYCGVIYVMWYHFVGGLKQWGL